MGVGVDRKTIASQVGKGCAQLHDRRMVGLRVARLDALAVARPEPNKTAPERRRFRVIEGGGN
jgi:hypothetical protein